MKHFVIVLFTLSMLACSARKPSDAKVSVASVTTVTYDSVLAKKLGADEYGMHAYVMAFLKKGPNREQDPEKAKLLQKAHLENIGKLAEQGKLVVAGPFMDDGDLRGIYVFNVATVEEAKKLTETDPLIQSGGLVMELHPWYCTAGLVMVNEIHKKVAKVQI